MRRQLVVLMFVVVTAAIGAASVIAAGRSSVEEVRESSAAPVAVQRVPMPDAGLRDEAAMVLVGSALIGLAAAVRRAA